MKTSCKKYKTLHYGIGLKGHTPSEKVHLCVPLSSGGIGSQSLHAKRQLRHNYSHTVSCLLKIHPTPQVQRLENDVSRSDSFVSGLLMSWKTALQCLPSYYQGRLQRCCRSRCRTFIQLHSDINEHFDRQQKQTGVLLEIFSGVTCQVSAQCIWLTRKI